MKSESLLSAVWRTIRDRDYRPCYQDARSLARGRYFGCLKGPEHAWVRG